MTGGLLPALSSRAPVRGRRPYAREELPQLRNEAEWCFLLALRAEGACPSVGAGFFQDFVAGLFNFEGKIWRTLPMLAWQTGRDDPPLYCRRARAVHLAGRALSYSHVFGMFAVLNFTGALERTGARLPRAAVKDEGSPTTRAKLAKLESQARNSLPRPARASTTTSTPQIAETESRASPTPKRCSVAQRSHSV